MNPSDEEVDALLRALRDRVARTPRPSAAKGDRPYEDLATAAEDFIFVIELDGTIDYINPASAKFLGVGLEDLQGRPFSDLELLPPVEEAEELLATVISKEEVVRYERAIQLGSDTRHLYATLSPMRDSDGTLTAILGMAKDVTDLAQTLEELRSLSMVDDLTGIYNRRGFLSLASQYLSLAARNGSVLCLIMIDMDGLKLINDRFGHHEGDAALIALASILRDNCRRSDVVARIGGDEFALLATGVSEGNSAYLVERLEQAIKIEDQEVSRPYKFSASVGAAEWTQAQPYTLDQLMAAADAKMYEAKRKPSS